MNIKMANAFTPEARAMLLNCVDDFLVNYAEERGFGIRNCVVYTMKNRVALVWKTRTGVIAKSKES